MWLSYFFLFGTIPSLFGIILYNLTSIVTKTELTGTDKLFTLLLKWFVSFIYGKIWFAMGRRDGDQQISIFLMYDTQLNLSLVFQDCLVDGFLVECKILVFLGYLLLGHMQFFEEIIFRFWTFLLFGWPFCYVVMLGIELITCSLLCQIITDWLLLCSCLWT